MQAMAHNLSSDVFYCDVIHLVIYYLIPLPIADRSWIRCPDLFCLTSLILFCLITAGLMSYKVFSKLKQHLTQVLASFT